jgi:hypothetical protein
MGIETALEIPAGEGSKFPSSFSFDMTAGARTQRHWEQREPTDNAGLQAVEQTAPQAGTVEDQRQALKRCTKAPGRNPLQVYFPTPVLEYWKNHCIYYRMILKRDQRTHCRLPNFPLKKSQKTHWQK